MSTTTHTASITAAYGTGITQDIESPWIQNPLQPLTPLRPFIDPGELPGSARLQTDGTVRIAEEDLLNMLAELKELREKVKGYEEMKAQLSKLLEDTK